mmetsp:Transcript_50533/g.61969  ORF Transcript_50533/g.61969 Transcript_50533/m.61969 type:complete len:191 (+) Transcript_50533:31-603(+)
MPELASNPEGTNSGTNDANNDKPKHGVTNSQHIRDKIKNLPEENIYEANERGDCYNCIRLIWCGCCEPYATITTKMVLEERWENCHRISDSMAFENIMDVRREQTCCCLITSYLPCCPCIIDMGNIVIYGDDDSVKVDTNDKTNKGKRWVLRRINHSFRVFEDITGHLQELHADWRKLGRRIGRKIQQVK